MTGQTETFPHLLARAVLQCKAAIRRIFVRFGAHQSKGRTSYQKHGLTCSAEPGEVVSLQIRLLLKINKKSRHNQDRACKYRSTNCTGRGDNRCMFQRRPKPTTIGSVRLSGQRVVITCSACRTITYVAAADLNHSDKFQIDVLDRVMTCPSCKAYAPHISVTVEAL